MFDLTFRLPATFREILPEQWQEYAPAVATGLETLVAGLSAERRAALLHELLEEGADASVESQLLVLARNCPTLHKLGQILARDPRLPESLRERLRQLESLPPRPLPEALRESILEQCESPLGHIELGTQTLAEGSVAAVVPFKWVRAVSGTTEEGVIKVHKPGAVAAIAEELRLWPTVGATFAAECERLGIAAPNSADLFGRMQEVLERETDLDGERKNLQLARRRFRRHRGVEVPRLMPFGDRGLLAMTRLVGRPLSALEIAGGHRIDLPEERAREVAKSLFEALVLSPLLQARDTALVHGDPHAGNLFLLEGDRIGLLDWSLAAELTKRERVLLVQAVLAGLLLDRKRLQRSMERLAETVRDSEELAAVIAEAVTRVHEGRLPGIVWLVELIDRLVLSGSVRFAPNLLVLRKSWVALAGVLLELDPAFSADRRVAVEIVRRAILELPLRFVSLPFSRSFSNHLSNLDLVRLATSGPAVLRNFWREVMAGSETFAAENRST